MFMCHAQLWQLNGASPLSICRYIKLDHALIRRPTDEHNLSRDGLHLTREFAENPSNFRLVFYDLHIIYASLIKEKYLKTKRFTRSV